ncbi:uncharacterized protein DFL_006384 [Arthrobotrys flagrans]|uniref:Uncharacterized protein n=1 Tax=Arthrobotrys flagrans TaxID=97331 RepID=A0A437A115_ARTFL|nr:hypothetical protein DFL_006384 [Arthrobotrys flagrans]
MGGRYLSSNSTILKLGIKAAVDDTSALSEVITEFCQKLFTEEGSMLLDRISIIRGRCLMKISYSLSIIFTFYHLGSWSVESLINSFGIRGLWNDPYLYYYRSRSISPAFVFFGIRILISIDCFMVCAALFGSIYANDFEAKIRDEELYQELAGLQLEWRKKCEDTVRVADEVVSCHQQRRLGLDPANPIPSPTPSIDYTIGNKLSTLLRLLSQLQNTNKEITHIHSQIQRNDQSLAELYFILAAITTGILSWSWKLNAIMPNSSITTCITVVAGIFSTVLFAVSGVYVAWRVERRRRVVEKCGDVSNQIIEVLKSAQRNHSFLVWVYATNHGTPRFTTEDSGEQWGEWVEGVNVDVNEALNNGVSDQLGGLSHYLEEVKEGIVS